MNKPYADVALIWLRHWMRVLLLLVLGWVFAAFILSAAESVFGFDIEAAKWALIATAAFLLIMFLVDTQAVGELRAATRSHAAMLADKRKMLRAPNEYGVIDPTAWEAEKVRFLEMMNMHPREMNYSNSLHYVETVASEYVPTVPETPAGDGIGYEEDCRAILEQEGWQVLPTPTTGDRGVDLVALRDDLKVAIQCKHHQHSIGTSSVQEIFAGAKLVHAEYAVVVGSGDFTQQAREMASALEVYLMRTHELRTLYQRFA